MLPRIAVTMGDPAGVGPEVVIKALSSEEVKAACCPVVVGAPDIMEDAAQIVGYQGRIQLAADLAGVALNSDEIAVVSPHTLALTSVPKGQISSAAGHAALACIVDAVQYALRGSVDAVVTAPIHKEALRASGCQHAGHTELLASLTGARAVAMMLVAGTLRVSHVTTHQSLRQACERVQKRRILEVISLTHQAVIQMGVERPRLAVAGLNPHAGEGGLFGREEIDEITPAIEAAQEAGIDAFGPLPPDTVFYLAVQGSDSDQQPIHAVVAMVHDHGHIAVKLVGFMVGVNVTLGLPIIRTSPDHGTAFDKAGKGTADPSSMVEAILLAAQMSRCPRPSAK